MKIDTLYIIGCGFDLAHSMPACYSCFKSYLSKNNGKRNECVECPYKDILPCDNKKCYILSLLSSAATSEEWNNFEQDLALLDFRSLGIKSFPKLDNLIDNMYDDLQEAFHAWINSIVLPSRGCGVYKIEPNAFFLTFNYTMTLEQTYSIAPSHVCHIHGSYDNQCKTGEKYVFGHNIDHKNIKQRFLQTMSGNDATIIDEWSLAIDRLKKDSFSQCHILRNWLKQSQLRNCTTIKIIGHSFSEVDFDYFKEIYTIFPDAHWIYYYLSLDSKCKVLNNVTLFKNKFGIRHINITFEPTQTILK